MDAAKRSISERVPLSPADKRCGDTVNFMPSSYSEHTRCCAGFRLFSIHTRHSPGLGIEEKDENIEGEMMEPPRVL